MGVGLVEVKNVYDNRYYNAISKYVLVSEYFCFDVIFMVPYPWVKT